MTQGLELLPHIPLQSFESGRQQCLPIVIDCVPSRSDILEEIGKRLFDTELLGRRISTKQTSSLRVTRPGTPSMQLGKKKT